MQDLSIADLEAAINFFRKRSPTDERAPVLCREASVLADAYALMIMGGKDSIQASELTDGQRVVMEQYLREAAIP